MAANTKIPPNSEATSPQSRNPQHNKVVLLEATLDSIAEVGVAETTVSAIIQRAGLSRGMIHLHFGGKEGLMVGSASYFSEIYYDEMDRQLALASSDPADVVLAVVRADLSPEILNERSVAIWHAFRGEARTNKRIAQFSDTRDKRLREMIQNAFEALIVEQGTEDAATVAKEVTLGTLALLEGMWTDYMTHTNAFSRDTAYRIIIRFLRGIIPDRFTLPPE